MQRRLGQRGERRRPAHDGGELGRPTTAPARPSPRCAGRARRAGCAGSAATRSPRPSSARRPPRTTTRSPRYLGNTTPVDTAPTWWPGAADPLQPGRDARRRLDLDDEVDRAHVDAQLQAGRGHDARQHARPSAPPRPACAAPATSTRGAPSPRWPPRRRRCPDCPIASAGNSSSSCAPSASSAASSLSRDVSRSASRRELANTIVDRCCAHQLQEPRSTAGQIDGRCAVPAAEPIDLLVGAARAPAARRARRDPAPAPRPSPRRSSACAAGRPRPGGRPARNVDTSSSGRTVADSPMRWAGRVQQLVEPLQRQREVRAALRARDRVHLVEDHRGDARAATPAPPR